MPYRQYNPNPNFRRTGDCSVRAISAALGVDWYTAYDLICDEGRILGNMPSGDETWGNVLKNEGFRRWAVPHHCNGCYTAEDFSIDNPDGTFVLAFGGHVATVKDSYLLDSWDSSMESPVYVWSKTRPHFI